MAIPADIRAAILKRAVQLFIVVLIMAASLFLSAGRLDWWNGWLLLGLYVIQMVCTGALLIRKDPEPIAERASYKKGAKSWDKVLAGMMGLYGPMPFGSPPDSIREITGRTATRLLSRLSGWR